MGMQVRISRRGDFSANPKGIEAFSPAVATKELPWVHGNKKFNNPERRCINPTPRPFVKGDLVTPQQLAEFILKPAFDSTSFRVV
jgi:hypothetical protein